MRIRAGNSDTEYFEHQGPRKRMMKSVTPGLLFVLIGIPFPCSGGLYKYWDADGKLYFTNAPLKDSKYRLEWKRATNKLIEESNNRFIAFRRRLPVPSNKLPALSKRLSVRGNRYAALIECTARRFKLRPKLLHAVIRAESAYNPTAVSSAVAVGLMQLMPHTAARYKVSDPSTNRPKTYAGARNVSVFCSRCSGTICVWPWPDTMPGRMPLSSTVTRSLPIRRRSSTSARYCNFCGPIRRRRSADRIFSSVPALPWSGSEYLAPGSRLSELLVYLAFSLGPILDLESRREVAFFSLVYQLHVNIPVSEVRLSCPSAKRDEEQGPSPVATSRNAAIGCERRASRRNIHVQRV